MYANINIKVTEEVKDALDKLKVHPREPYHEIIAKMIELYVALKTMKDDHQKDIDEKIGYNMGKNTDKLKDILDKL